MQHITRFPLGFEKISLLLFIFILPAISFSTHIVGGAITYEYNGGSSYTITLKLYRDCAGVAFPDPVNISVVGYNGAAFNPSRDFSMNLGTVTPVPSNLDTCADPPSPMPCVQEGIYTATVNNLPPNPGGYHLYYQIIARNLSLTNIDATCNCIGESFYAYIPGMSVAWLEQFTLPNGTISDAGTTAWTRTLGTTPPGYASVQANLFEFSGNNDATATWSSQVIDISSFPAGVNLSVELSENSGLEANDSIIVYYSLDGGAFTPFAVNGFFADDFTSGISTQTNLIGNNVRIFVYVHYDANSGGELYRLDNVWVTVNDFPPNNNAEFTVFPPLFLCVGQPFSFDHSATDSDGDSLVYSFYTPYDGDNGIGPLDPSFSNNTAIFQPIVYQPGYSFSNPLGGTPLVLNSSTGLLTGTPTLLGQFVVGVMVKEYRDGVCIDSTLRDFQFNVVNCPPPATAVLPDTLFACSGLDVTFSNLGNPSSNNWWNFGDPAVTNDTSLLANPSYNYPIEGYYDVVLITNKGTFCADTDSAVVLVAWVDAGFVADTVGCAGDLFDFNDTSTSSSNLTINGYQWNFGDGNNSFSADTSHIFISNGTFTVTHIVTTNLGCSDTVTKNVVVSPAPVFVIDMTGNPDSVWTSPSVVRNCEVCGATAPDVCITFILTLDPATQAISFDITSGAIPPGALYYQLSCGDSNQVGDTICIDGVGPHQITFCKPGNNPNSYTISAILAPDVSPPVTVSDGCMDTIYATGFNESTLTWTSVSPGAQGVYDSYLNCAAGCDTVVVTSQPGYPPSVNYMVCGFPTGAGSCSMTPVCDTTTVYFVSTLATDINPINPTICFGGSNVTITAVPTGGAAPYSYLWSTGEITASISVGVGTYFVTVSDTTNCQPVSDSVVVTAFSSAITANAGPDQTVCNNYPDVTLSGIITAASGGTWFGGSGTFSPSADSLNTTYTPTATEISIGSMQLFLVTTGNGSCPADTDTMNISFIYFSAAVSVSSTDALCFDDSTGTAAATVSGGLSPITYLWNTGATTSSISNLPAATYNVIVTENNGCDTIISSVINEPPLLSAAISDSSNVLCFGGNDGAATVSANGGTSPYTYLWSSSETDSTALSLLADTAYVTITDNNNCITVQSVIITEPPLLTHFMVSNPDLCCTKSGACTVFISGGTSPFSYWWSNGDSIISTSADSSRIDSLYTGSYSVTIVDANGCTDSDTVLVGGSGSPPNALGSNMSIGCFADCNGWASVNASGGTSPYTYQWSNGETTLIISNLCAGPYPVTVIDANQCTADAIAIVAQPNEIILATSGTNVSCNSGNNGSATVTASEGTPGYTYSWSNGATTSSVSNLQANAYTVTVSDANSCIKISSITITQPTAILLSTSSTDVSCNGGNDGSASVAASGGTPGYTYSWSNGATSSSITNLQSNSYTVTVSDVNSCPKIASVTVSQPLVISLSTSSTPASCKGGNNGTATASASGGNGGFTFSWSNGGSGPTINSLSAGTYSVTATDIYGCNGYGTVTVTEPATLVSVSASATDASCNGVCDGTLSSSASGGTGGKTFLWSGGLGIGAGKTNVCAGTYTVTATDTNGCTATANATVYQPAILVVTSTATDALCKDSCNGTLSATATGGTTNYSFLWSMGLGTGATISNVCDGNYIVTVTDANGCTDTSGITVYEPAALTSVTSSSAVTCFGGNDGTATVSSSGGSPSYSFVWDTNANSQTDTLATALPAGTYSVTTTDVNGCFFVSSVIVIQPAFPLSISIVNTNVSCFGGNNGSAISTASGGTSPYFYLWNTGDTTSSVFNLQSSVFNVTATDNNGCSDTSSVYIDEPDSALSAETISDSVSCKGGNDGSASVTAFGGTSPFSYLWNTSDTAPQISNLISQIYSVTVTDSNSCTFTASAVIEEPASLLTLDTSTTMVVCNGDDDGTATVIPSGGVAPYSYLWDTNANSQIDSTATGLLAGTYSVTVTDNNGCARDTILFVDQPFSPLSISLAVDSVKCFGGNDGIATVTPYGGTSPYTFQWDDAFSQTDSTATGLTANTYSVTVTDYTQNCKVGNSIIVGEPDSLILNPASTNVSCFGGNDGMASVSPSGGTSPYSYLWSNNQTIFQISNLISQAYSVTVSDNNNCTDSGTFYISQPAFPLTISALSSEDVKCNGGNDGEAAVLVSGGTSPYAYLWNDPNQTNTSNISGLIAGLYTIIITDSNNCVIDTSVLISQPTPGLTVSVSATDVKCFLGNDGTATVTPAGGTPPYFYLWDSLANSQTDSTATGLFSGTYNVTVTDNNGCILDTNSSVFVGQPAMALSVILSASNVSCSGGNDGSAEIFASGGTSPYIYAWSNGDSSSTTTNLTAQTYFATVTDYNGCTDDTISITVTEPPPLMVSPSSEDVICKGENNGSATITPTGGTAPYSYQWDAAAFSQTDSTATGLIAGTYFVTVTDFNGCLADSFVPVSEPQDSLLLAASFSDVLCFGDSTGTATVTPSGGVSPYYYQWDSNAGFQTGSTATGLIAGTYSVTVADFSGCSDSSVTISLSEPPMLMATATQNDTICPGESASISVTGSGGISPYTYDWNIGQGQNQSVSPAINTTYTVVVSDQNNCASTPDSVIVFVRNYYFDSLVFDCGSPSCVLCPGGSTQISASYYEEFPPYSYIWLGLGTGLGPFTVSPDETTGYILQVSDQCGSFQDTLTVFVDSFPKIDLPAVYGDACVPMALTFQNSVQNPAGSVYSWDFGDGGTSSDTVPTYEYETAGTYIVSLLITSPNNCSVSSDTATTVFVRPLPEPDCSANPTIANLQNPVINFQTGSFSSYLWDFGDGDTSSGQNPVHEYSDSGYFTVTVFVTNQYACENFCEVEIRINPVYPLGIPNAFTPDPNGPNGGTYSFNDFTNNVFFPITRYVTEYHLEIFNRWGELLFESFDIDRGWDGYYRGELCQQDVYVWKIYIRWWDGQTFNDVGDVTLLR